MLILTFFFIISSWIRDDNDLGTAELELYMDRVEKEEANHHADETDGADQPNTQAE